MTEAPSLRSRLRSRFRGALLGGAIGDALGFPFEGSSHSFMTALGADVMKGFEAHRSGYFPPGQFSDDTQLTLATAESLIEAQGFRGEALAASFLPLWRENTIIGRSSGCTEAVERLLDGSADWTTSGCEPGRAGNGAAKRALPFGLWSYDDPEGLVRDTALAARITHRDPRAIAGATGVAASAAYAVTHREVILGEWIDVVGAAMAPASPEFAEHVRALPRFLSLGEEEALRRIATLGFEDPASAPHDRVTPFVIPSILTAFYWFLRHPDDWTATVAGCLRSGGDVDTIASIGGGISGAFNGAESIPAALREGVVDRERIVEIADRLYSAKESARVRRTR